MNKKPFRSLLVLLTVSMFLSVFSAGIQAAEPVSPTDVLGTKTLSQSAISPDGKWIAYTIRIPRTATDKPGGSYTELYLMNIKTGANTPFITGKVNVGSLHWSPDGTQIAFTTHRGEKAKTQVWIIPRDGGEAWQATHSPTSVLGFAWHPNGKQIAYMATTPQSKKEKELKKKGFGFIYYEENLKHRNIYLQDLDKKTDPVQLTSDKTIWSFNFSHDGKTIAAAASPKNLVDHRYMFQKLYLLDIASKKMTQLTDNPGKLGSYSWSPDNKRIAYTAASTRADHAVSQVYVIEIAGKKVKNLTIDKFKGHVTTAYWKNNKTVAYIAGEGVWSTLSLVPADGGQRKIIFNAKDTGVIFRNLDFSKDFRHAVFTGSSPAIPGDLYYWQVGKKLKQLTTLNPWLADRELGKQEIIRFNARDGQEIEGLLIYPTNYKKGETYPLVVTVHGGPESHYFNSWLTRYATPGQVLAGKGYLVYYPNYRASTGYGVDFAMAGYEDAAGVEFDDIADGIKFLVKEGLADGNRVGLGGGSYGGYAAGWFGTYYTKLVRAVCMFVGISDLVSKRGTTDIPYEELYVHSGKPLEEMWEQNLKRSPIYWAHQSKSAFLIFGGADDPRVHPTQSMELFRRLKMNHHPATRLVQYPGEGHGNRRQPGQIDVIYRVLDWYDWYVKEAKPLDGPMPPLDISDKYGLDLKEN